MVRYSAEGRAHLHLASPCALKLDLKGGKKRKPPQAPALELYVLNHTLPPDKVHQPVPRLALHPDPWSRGPRAQASLPRAPLSFPHSLRGLLGSKTAAPCSSTRCARPHAPRLRFCGAKMQQESHHTAILGPRESQKQFCPRPPGFTALEFYKYVSTVSLRQPVVVSVQSQFILWQRPTGTRGHPGTQRVTQIWDPQGGGVRQGWSCVSESTHWLLRLCGHI